VNRRRTRRPSSPAKAGDPVTNVPAIKAKAEPFIHSRDYWIVRLRGR
jgi:hypothetical protein